MMMIGKYKNEKNGVFTSSQTIKEITGNKWEYIPFS
jgi:hypothetical protein